MQKFPQKKKETIISLHHILFLQRKKCDTSPTFGPLEMKLIR